VCPPAIRVHSDQCYTNYLERRYGQKMILGELTNALVHLEPHGLGDGTRWSLKILNHPRRFTVLPRNGGLSLSEIQKG